MLNFLKDLRSLGSDLVISLNGFKTDSKILVIESDDWGAISTPSLEVSKEIRKKFKANSDPYSLFDTLENDNDVFELKRVLRSVSSCLKEINLAFKFSKPAVISLHRINYTSRVRTEIRDFGLRSLNKLLNKAKSRWPDVRFISSIQLAEFMDKDFNG